MNTKQTFEILFWIEKRRLKNGRVPIHVRVTVNGSRKDLPTHRWTSLIEWDQKSQTIDSESPEAKEVNNHLSVIKAKILNCQSKLEARNVEQLPTQSKMNTMVSNRKEKSCWRFSISN